MATNETRTPPSLFVCITGQAARLELQNKKKVLLDPLGSWAHLKMSLLLSTGSAQYANPPPQDSQSMQSPSLDQISFRVHDIIPDAEVVDYTRGPNPLVHQRYLERLDKSPQTNRRRVPSHVRQWTASAACFGRMEMWERSRTMFFDYFIRVREDVVLLRLSKTYVFRHLQGDTVLAPECDSHRNGMNDKIAFGTRSSAFPYFTAPLLHYVNGALPNISLLNPEQYWLWSIIHEGLGFERVPRAALSALGSRRRSDRTCLKCSQQFVRCYTRGLNSDEYHKLIASCC